MDHADRRRSRIDDRDILASRLSGSQKRPVVRTADGGANAEHNDRVFGRNIGEQLQKSPVLGWLVGTDFFVASE